MQPFITKEEVGIAMENKEGQNNTPVIGEHHGHFFQASEYNYRQFKRNLQMAEHVETLGTIASSLSAGATAKQSLLRRRDDAEEDWF